MTDERIKTVKQWQVHLEWKPGWKMKMLNLCPRTCCWDDLTQCWWGVHPTSGNSVNSAVFSDLLSLLCLWTEGKKTKRWVSPFSLRPSLASGCMCYWLVMSSDWTATLCLSALSPTTLHLLLLPRLLPPATWVIKGFVIVSGLVFLAVVNLGCH